MTTGRYCAAHKQQQQREQDARRGSAYSRGYGKRWQKYRAIYLIEHPYCVKCDEPATVVDHVQDHKGNYRLFWDASNHQALCKRCHDRKTARGNMATPKRIVVCGPPASGKTTWVQQRRKAGDLVLDVDAIGATVFGCTEHEWPDTAVPMMSAIREAVVRFVKQRWQGKAYLIVSDKHSAQQCAQAIGAEIVTMDTGLDTCRQRAAGRGASVIAAIERWAIGVAPTGRGVQSLGG